MHQKNALGYFPKEVKDENVNIGNLHFFKDHNVCYKHIKKIVSDNDLNCYLTIVNLINRKQPVLSGDHPEYVYDIINFIMTIQNYYHNDSSQRLNPKKR